MKLGRTGGEGLLLRCLTAEEAKNAEVHEGACGTRWPEKLKAAVENGVLLAGHRLHAICQEMSNLSDTLASVACADQTIPNNLIGRSNVDLIGKKNPPGSRVDHHRDRILYKVGGGCSFEEGDRARRSSVYSRSQTIQVRASP